MKIRGKNLHSLGICGIFVEEKSQEHGGPEAPGTFPKNGLNNLGAPHSS